MSFITSEPIKGSLVLFKTDSFMKISKKKAFISVLFFFFTAAMIAQTTIETPNFGSKSHPTLLIEKIERTNQNTKIYMNITNYSTEGDWFCVDKNVAINQYPNKTKIKMNAATGVPQCPENYQFTKVEETLPFVLDFPALEASTKYIDIIEQCNNACFTFKGVIVDKDLNLLINEAYTAYSDGLSYKALALFKEAVKQTEDYPYGILYFNIIKIYITLEQPEEAQKWTDKIKASKFDDKDFLLQQLNVNK
jgi:tetratricopeptide (TPR) repeat protein